MCALHALHTKGSYKLICIYTIYINLSIKLALHLFDHISGYPLVSIFLYVVCIVYGDMETPQHGFDSTPETDQKYAETPQKPVF